MRAGRLYILVFMAGFATLGAELTTARLLAPFFGTSTLVWANVIGLTLLFLSVGYWLGGRLADRWPTQRRLGSVVMLAAITIAMLPFATKPLLTSAAEAFASVGTGVVISSFIAVLLMFAVPITALGAVAPWAIRLSVNSIEEAGRVSGRLYALSTVGSLLGTFVSVLLLVPWIGTRRTLLVLAVLLAAAAVPLLPRRATLVPVLLALLLLVPERGIKAAPGDRVVWEGESTYQFVQIVDDSGGQPRPPTQRGLGDTLHQTRVEQSRRGALGSLCMPAGGDRPCDRWAPRSAWQCRRYVGGAVCPDLAVVAG